MRSSRSEQRGFTLVELLTVILVLGIVICLTAAVVSKMRGRAHVVQCSANLKSLHVAAQSYMQDNQKWPQIVVVSDEKVNAQKWIDAFRPYGISERIWVCPAIQELLKSPDLEKPANRRTDYFATPFEDKPRKPYEWNTQPWFVERANAHGNGNLMIFMDGSIRTLNEMVPKELYKKK